MTALRLQPMPRIRHAPLPMRPLLHAWRWLQALYVRSLIWETEHHMRDCARDGLDESLSLQHFEAQIAALRIRLIDLTTRD